MAENGMLDMRNKFGLRITKSVTYSFNYKLFGARKVMVRGILDRPEINNVSLYYRAGWLSVNVPGMYLGDTNMATWMGESISFTDIF
jgi:hypothetical protein